MEFRGRHVDVWGEFELGDGIELHGFYDAACTFGHTDVAHAHTENASSCRATVSNDYCKDMPPPFVCTCVNEMVAFMAQDEVGADVRFYLVAGAMILGSVALVMLFLRSIVLLRIWAQRNCFRRANVLKRVRLEDEDDASRATRAKVARRKAPVDGELRELWRCVASCTFCVAIVGAPTLAVIATPKHYGYFPGCGFLLPPQGDVGARLVTRMLGDSAWQPPRL